MSVVLALDVGSSSVRAAWVLPDASGPLRLAGAVRRPVAFDYGVVGAATLDAEHVRALLESCIDEALALNPDVTVSAVALATFAGNWLGLNAANQPVTPLLTYADTRAARVAGHLAARLGHDAARERTGAELRAPYWTAQLSWWREQHGGLPARISDLAAWLLSTWFGRAVPMSISLASWSGLLNRAEANWDSVLCGEINLDPAILPVLADYSEGQIGLSGDYAARWPRLRDVPFLLGVGDGAAATVGGTDSEDVLTVTVGTTAAVRRVSRALPTVAPGLWSYRIDRARHVFGGALNEGGSTYGWASRVLNLDAADVQSALVSRPPSATLLALPYLTGERSPGYHVEATGAWVGMRASHSAADLLLAMLDSVTLRLAALAERMGEASELVAGGGGLIASPAWAQRIADALGRPVGLLASEEVTALGLARLAHQALGLDVPPPSAVGARFAPRVEYAAAWASARQAHDGLYAQLIEG